MSDETKSKLGGSTIADLILAGLGLWFGVSSLMALTGSAPRDNVATLPVVLCIGWIGAWPTLLAGLGVAGVGTWAFLSPRPVDRLRHAAGALGVVLGVAIVLGALGAGAGGELGRVLPSLVPGMLGAAAGAAVGAAVVLATVWLAWSPDPTEDFSPKPGEERSIAAVGTPESASGVSHAEAEALIVPTPPPARPLALPRIPKVADDVRSRGGVPAGAQPLRGPHERTPEAPDPVGARQGQAAEPGQPVAVRPGADLASARPLATPAVQPLERPAARRDAGSPEALKPGVRHLADPEVAVRPIWESASAPAPAEPARPAPAPAAAADEPRASWEAPVEEEEAYVEEPVERLRWEDDEPDALAEDLEAAGVEEALEERAEDEDEAEEELDELDERAEDDEDLEDDLDEPAKDEDELEEALDEHAEDDEDDEDELDELAEDEDELAGARAEDDEDLEDELDELAEEGDEDELDEIEDEDDLDAVEPDAAAARAEVELAEDEASEEELDALAEEDEEELDAPALAAEDADEIPEPIAHAAHDAPELDAAASPELAEDEREDGESEPDADEPQAEIPRPAAPARKPRRAEPASAPIVQTGLFDEAEPVEVQPAPAKRAPAPAKRAAARAAQPAAQPAAPALPDGLEDLVFEAGCLLLDENRVAVSMLQRRFGLDFEHATLVLDALQQRGLIGPYQGGRTRDILMSREEWAAHAPGV